MAMLTYREITPTAASIAKGRAEKSARETHGLTVDDWIGLLAVHVEGGLTPEQIATIEAGSADLATPQEWARRDADTSKLVGVA